MTELVLLSCNHLGNVAGTMNLHDYLVDPKRKAQLVRDLRTSPVWLWQIATGWRGKRPSPRFAQAIERATHGVVTCSELRPDVWPPAAAKEADRHVA